jgi:hypothetical protein
VREADAELVSHRQRVRRLRDDYKAVGASKTQAETAKDRAIQEAEELRENLQNQQPDSGKIVAYEEAITVYLFYLIYLIEGCAKREESPFNADCSYYRRGFEVISRTSTTGSEGERDDYCSQETIR